jgi:hypothetical protein
VKSAKPQAKLAGYHGPYYTDGTSRMAVVLVGRPWHDGNGPDLESFVAKIAAYSGKLSLQTDDGYHWAALYHFVVDGHDVVLAIPRPCRYVRERKSGHYEFNRMPCLYLKSPASLWPASIMLMRLLRLMSETD